jgi:uncharacterized protein YbjT (DUF2867 family)
MVALVGGAHGWLSSRVAARLLRRGHVVRALVRTDAQTALLRHAGVVSLFVGRANRDRRAGLA